MLCIKICKFTENDSVFLQWFVLCSPTKVVISEITYLTFWVVLQNGVPFDRGCDRISESSDHYTTNPRRVLHDGAPWGTLTLSRDGVRSEVKYVKTASVMKYVVCFIYHQPCNRFKVRIDIWSINVVDVCCVLKYANLLKTILFFCNDLFCVHLRKWSYLRLRI